MHDQMLRAIRDTLKRKSRTAFAPVSGLLVRHARYISPENYEYLTEFAPAGGETVILPGTNFIRVSVKMPDEILKNEDFEDYLSVSIPWTEGFVQVDGEHYHGLDNNRSRIPLRSEWAGKTMELLLTVFGKEKTLIREFGFERIDKKIESAYYLYTVVSEFDWMERQRPEHENAHIRKLVERALDDSVKDLDLDLEGQALRDSIALAEARLQKSLSDIDDGDVRGLISLIGHTHIDVAWLWQLKDTVRKCGHSFTNALRLMEEYPEYTFSCSQLQLMDYTKKYYPEVFSQIKERVKEGRWEAVGPMWVESDCNVTSGESLVRQLIYGIKFAREEFGVKSEVAWLPDTFGFQPNMPQILKKSGTKYFYSYKLHWQHQNRFPYGMFRWQGIDGSEIVSSVAYNPGGYNGYPNPQQLRGAKDNNLQNGEFDNVIFPYGYGDGGGGPTREMLEYARRLEDFPGLPRTKLERADEYFARLEEQREKLPVWFGELYIETHRGTLTSAGLVKKNNRRAESLSQYAEKLGVFTQLFGAEHDWGLLAESWKNTLLLQFHDILPGSSIRGVYSEDCPEHYKIIFDNLDKFISDAQNNFAKPGSGALAVFNSLSWPRDAVCEYSCEKSALPASPAVFDADGNALPFVAEDSGDGKIRLVFLAKGLPAMGFGVYRIGEGAAPEGKSAEVSGADDGRWKVETAGFVTVIDAEGRLESVYDKKADREALAAPANDIRLFRDGPQHEDAWNIYDLYKERPFDPEWETEVWVKENSPLRLVMGVKKTAENFKIEQDIVIYPDSPVIDFKTKVDWREKHKVMRVYFPANVKSQMAAYEVGFGTFLRPTVATTPYDKSKFEVCAHRFADLSEGEYGVSVLNDCKYGHDCQDNTIGVTLLRGTTHPDPLCDLGEHEINYSLYPHAGDWRAALTARRGLELNTPLIAVEAGAEPAARFAGKSLVSCGNENIIVDTIKPAEDGNGVILRAYECNGNRGRAELSFLKTPARAEETDLIEEKIADARLLENRLSFAFAPFEIKTFRLVF